MHPRKWGAMNPIPTPNKEKPPKRKISFAANAVLGRQRNPNPAAKGPRMTGVWAHASHLGFVNFGEKVKAEKAWGKLMPNERIAAKSPAAEADRPRSTRASERMVAGRKNPIPIPHRPSETTPTIKFF